MIEPSAPVASLPAVPPAVLAQVWDCLGEGMVVTDAANRIIAVNPALLAITGYTAAELLGANPRVLASGRHSAAFYALLWQTLQETGGWEGELWNRRRNGEVFPAWMRMRVLRDANGNVTHHVAVCQDLSDRKQAEARILYLSQHDALTGLPNHLLLRDRTATALRQAQAAGQGVALLVLDIDLFKHVNDALGHAVGDTLLQVVAYRLRSLLPDATAISRQGGDEFCVLLAGLSSPDQAEAEIARIQQAFLQPFVLDERELRVSFSIGMAYATSAGDDFDRLQRQAEQALFQAKQAGRSMSRTFESGQDVGCARRLDLQSALARAIEREELALYYQPLVALHNGLIVGAEALLRWRRPEMGLLSPAEFIPLAEEGQLIEPIGAWVLEEACRQHVRWQQAGLGELTMAVNVSALQFHRGVLEGQVQSALALSGMSARWLELELTESMMLQEPERVTAVMARLRDLGLRLVIDDFGTGYSSLAYLRTLPADQLKIDQSFVRDMEHDTEALAIVTTVIGLARSLQMSVLAEGVESLEMAMTLHRLGCDYAQGYFFGRPMPADAFTRLLREQRPTILASPASGKC